MYDQEIREDILYMMLYGAATMLSLAAAGYLLLRRANAIAPDVASPKVLRRWTAAFFASMALSHVWYMPTFYLTSTADVLLCNLIGATLDFMTFVPFGIIVLLSMLQDRRRSPRPAFVMVAPLVAIMAVCTATRNIALLPVLYAYYLLMGIGLTIYMVYQVRRYGRWLRDNYADLEHKEVWQSLAVLAVILSFFGAYTLDPHGVAYKYITQANNIILVCYLLWRVETLSDLTVQEVSGDEVAPLSGYEVATLPGYEVATLPGYVVAPLSGYEVATLPGYEVATLPGYVVAPLSGFEVTSPDNPKTSKAHNLKTSQPKDLTLLLQRHCIDTQLYLQHDLTVTQLARAIGTNRFYLSQHFSRQGITYNAYINSLRIRHFMSLYRKAVADRQHVTAQQLATESGFHNYRTFSNAFKLQTGQTVTGWMKANARQEGMESHGLE